MKLRLPIALATALVLSCTLTTHAEITTTHYSGNFPDGANLAEWPNFNLLTYGADTVNFGDGNNSPTVAAKSWTLNGKMNIKSGQLTLTGVIYDLGEHIPVENEISLWIGGHTGSDHNLYDAVIDLSGGKLIADKMVILSRNGANNKGFLNISGTGYFKAQGIYSNVTVTSDTGRPGEINLTGGQFILGEKGMNYLAGTTPYSIKFENGTVGAYANWTAVSGITITLGDLPESSLIVDTMGFDITWQSALTGAGAGTLTKTGQGTLFITSAENTFTQNVVLAGGALVISKDRALGAVTKTITVINDGSSDNSSFDIQDLTWSLRYTDYSFLVQNGAKLLFPKGNDVMFDFGGHLTFEGGAQVTFEDELMLDSGGGMGEAVEKMQVQAGAEVILKDTFYLSKSTQVALSGTMTVEKDAEADGIVIGGYHGNMWNTSKFVIEDGGLLNMPKAKVSLGKGLESGQFIINEGGKAIVWGVEDKGSWGNVAIAGGTLELGKGGIHFNDQSDNNDGDPGKSGEHYLSDVYFSSGKIVVNEDSAYTYTGKKEFAAINGRPASVYTGNFFFGKDNTGALDDAASTRTIEVGNGATFSLTEIILGDGGFNKTGKGTVVLSAANGYKGDTVVEEGALHLGDDSALGVTGKLTLLSGTAIAALGKNISAANNVDMGRSNDSAYSVTFGQSGKTDTLTLGGTTRLLATGATFDTMSDITFSGPVTSNAVLLTKTGAGTLGFTQALTGVQTLNVNAGGLLLGGTTLSGIKTLHMAADTTLDLSGQIGTPDKNITIAGATALKGFGSYTGTVAMQEYTSRLNVTDNFQTGKISFKLGKDNASFDGATKTLVTTSGTAVITGTEKGSIVLDFDQDYLNTFMNHGGNFQLFSTGLSYQKGTIQNNQRKLIMLDESALGTTGTLTWSRIILSSDLITQGMADSMNNYAPSGSQSYLGSQGDMVIVGEDVVYDIEDNPSYNLTPGLGSLVYQGELRGADKELSIMGYAEIKTDAQPGEGSVIITNNENSYGAGTIVTGGRLTVDLSQGADSGSLTDQAANGNINVTALGTGEVSGVSGTKGGSEIILQAYGEQTLAGVNTYTYANDFALNGNSVLKQEGSNAQILTGDITSGAGANAIANAGNKDLTLKGNITQEDGTTLILRSETAAGRIILDGNKTLTAEQLTISGAGEIRTANGYTVTTRGLTLDNGTLTITGNGTLTLGQNGITGTGVLILNGGTIKSTSSWNSDAIITLGTGENTINTGGANVRFNKGVTGEGGFIKQGSGHLYIYDNPAGNAKGLVDVKQGRLVLLGANQDQTRTTTDSSSEYTLNGDLILSSGKGASLQGKINANGHNVTFGEGTHYYLEVAGESGITGYIRDAGTLTIGTGTQLHIDVLGDTWTTENTYTIFSSRETIQGASNLELTLNEEYAFVDVSLDTSNNKEIGLNLTHKGGTPAGQVNDGTNKGAINAAVAPLVAGVLDDSTELTGKLKQHIQKISKMTTTEYQTYLTGMGNSASSFYTALSAQVQDVTQHINSVRNRVELINPVMYDDWTEGGIYNMWAGGINHYRDVKSNSEAPGYEMTSWGGELGCAIPLSQTFMIGVGFAYTNTDVQVKDGWGSNDNDTYNVDLFARYRKDALTITGVLTGGFTNTEFHRNQILKDEYTRSNSSTDGNQFMGTIEAGYDFYLNEEKSWILQPLVNLTAGRAKLDSLSETGELKNAGLMIGSQSYNMFSAGIGARIAYQYKNSVSDLPGRVELKAMYVNDMGDVDFKVNGRFIGAPGNRFDLKGVSNERSAAIVSAGWIAPISAYGQFFVDAGCEFRKDQNGVNSTMGFSFQF